MRWKHFGLGVLALATFSILSMAGTFAQNRGGHREEIIKYLDEVWNKGNVNYVDKAMAPQITRFGHVDEGNSYGIDQYKAAITKIRSSFTDYNVTLLDMMGQDDKAVFKWQLRGNYVGPDKKLSPGRPVDIVGKTIWVMRDDKVIREIVEIDPEEYHRQIQMAQPYSEIDNRALMLSFLYEVVSQGEMPAVEALVSDKHVLHDIGNKNIVGPEGLRQHVQSLRAAFPDLSVKIYDVISAGNSVSARWTLEGTQKGSWRGLPASNRKVLAAGITFMNIKDKKIEETWNSLDLLAASEKPAG